MSKMRFTLKRAKIRIKSNDSDLILLFWSGETFEYVNTALNNYLRVKVRFINYIIGMKFILEKTEWDQNTENNI